MARNSPHLAGALRFRGPEGSRPARGFTLIELVMVLGMLVTVLAVAYSLILDCLNADRTIEKLTRPEKVGEGILSLLREDLSGTIYRNLGTKVFLVTDGGLPPDARDELRFLSTTEPTPREDASSGESVSVEELRSITGICYYLRPGETRDGIPAYTLFRKEIVDLDPAAPLEGPGMNYEIYDKVRYFSVECFDGWSWTTDWDSNVRIEEEQSYLASAEADTEGRIARVSDPQRSSDPQRAQSASSAQRNSIPGISTPGVAPTDMEEQTVFPPAGVPVAVRVEISIYVYAGDKVERDAEGNPLAKTYSTIVPLLVAQRLPMQLEDEMAMGDEEGVARVGEGGEEGGPANRMNPTGLPPDAAALLQSIQGKGGQGMAGSLRGARGTLGAPATRSGGMRAGGGGAARAPGGASGRGGGSTKR